MPPAPETLPELVQQLGSTYSPFERLKILSRAWHLLRTMTPQERLVVPPSSGWTTPTRSWRRSPSGAATRPRRP